MSGAPLNSGPAFPVPSGAYSHGMSLRDWFAGQALPTILRSTYSLTTVTQEQAVRDAVEYAYEIADAMLAAREGK